MAHDKLKNLLNPSTGGDLGALVRRAKEMGELTHLLGDCLGDEYAGALVAANLRDDGELVVIAASSAWASRLRYEADKMVETARRHGLNATRCLVRVSSG